MIERVGAAIGLAAAIALVGAVLGWQPWRGEDGPSSGGWGDALGVAGAAAATYAMLQGGVPDFPPPDATAWLFWFSVPVVVVALVDLYVGKPYVVWPLRVLLVGAGGYLLTEPLLQHAWAGFDGVMRVGVFALVTLGVWAALDRLVARAPDDSTAPLAMAFSAAAAAGAIAYVSSITIGLIAAALALGLGATVVMMWFRRRVQPRVAVSVFVPLLSLVYFAAHGYADIGAVPIALFVLALLLVWVGELLVNKKAWLRGAVRVALAVVPIAAAVPIAESAFAVEEGVDESRSTDDDGESDDGTYVPY